MPSRAAGSAAIAAAAAGVAVWALPLVWFSGGPRRYLQALGSQAGEDFSGVVMLWTHPTPRAAVAAILQTFVRPWDSPILAGVMLVLAAAGAFVLLTRSPRVAGDRRGGVRSVRAYSTCSSRKRTPSVTRCRSFRSSAISPLSF